MYIPMLVVVVNYRFLCSYSTHADTMNLGDISLMIASGSSRESEVEIKKSQQRRKVCSLCLLVRVFLFIIAVM